MCTHTAKHATNSTCLNLNTPSALPQGRCQAMMQAAIDHPPQVRGVYCSIQITC